MDYKSKIYFHFGGAERVDLTTLITAIIELYGEKNDSNKNISEHKLEEILINLLTTDGYDMACFVNNLPEAREKLNWYYDIKEGEGYISEKNKIIQI